MVSGGRSFAQNDDVQRVLDATDIVRLIGDHLALKRKGREYIGLCPFHDDHSPSMYVVPHKQIYHCFSCGAGGNAFGFVMNYHKMPFREALEYLAERSGITLTPRAPHRKFAAAGQVIDAEEGPATDRASLLSANAFAQTFFRTILAHTEHGRAAREIIERRGISPEMVEAFQLGAAPAKWDGLVLTIGNRQLPIDPFRTLGLVKSRENGPGFYDAFRNRVMFPIHDQAGRVIGFGGRRIDDQDEPKYINSAESPIFDKSTTLYGIHQAAQTIRQTRLAIVTEGYMDTIACHQAGVTNAVATLGTAMTPGNAKFIRRLCDTVVLLFDGDEAGQKAAERAVEVFFSEPVDVRIALLSSHTDAKDPDELLKRPGGREVFDRVIAGAVDPLELLFARIRTQIAGSGLSARSRAVDEYVARLVDLGLDRVDKLRYQLIIKRLAQIADVDWETIASTIAERRLRVRARTAPSQDAPQPLRASSPAEHLIGCILNDPSLTHALHEDQWTLIDPDAFSDDATRSVARTIADLIIDEQTPDLHRVLASISDPAAQQAATRLASEVDRLTDSDPDRLRRLWQQRLEAAAIVGGPTAAQPESQESEEQMSLEERLQRLRSKRGAVGNDPRAVPRPSS